MFKRFILWAVKRTPRYSRYNVVTFGDEAHLFKRFDFLWRDESIRQGKHYYRPPWYRPFNMLLHRWSPAPGVEEAFHDHPRWSATLCLRGELIEKTPWGERHLKPGSIVIRSRKAIHAFRIVPGHSGKTWTLFIVGRRNHRQNTYVITQR